MRVLLALLLLLPLASARAVTPEDLTGFAYAPHPGALLPMAAQFADETGRATTLGAVAGGRPLILALGYFACPNLCGVVRDDLLSALARSGLAAGRDYALAVLTIDPSETPATAARAKAEDLARYPSPGAAAGWRFLTGPAESLGAVEAAVGFRARFDPALKQFLHPAGLVFATPGGRVSGYLLGVGYAPSEVAAAVARAGAGEVAAAAQPVLLLCFHYDPATGRYTLAVMKVLRLAAVLTSLTLGVTLLLAHRRRRA